MAKMVVEAGILVRATTGLREAERQQVGMAAIKKRAFRISAQEIL